MRIYISADMEGVTGVTHSQDVIPGRSQYKRFRGVLSHTFDAPTVVTGVELNSEPCSEARMNATLAGTTAFRSAS